MFLCNNKALASLYFSSFPSLKIFTWGAPLVLLVILSCQSAQAQARFAFSENVDVGVTVIDQQINLEWVEVNQLNSPQKWSRALKYCSDLSSDGDWRLPNVLELSSLIEDQLHEGIAINLYFFPSVKNRFGVFWSSTTDPTAHNNAMVVFFNTTEVSNALFSPGSVSRAQKSPGANSFFCVRTLLE